MEERNTMSQPYRIAVVGIIVENPDLAGSVNEILHQYSSYIIGRMGLPYREKQMNIMQEQTKPRRELEAGARE